MSLDRARRVSAARVLLMVVESLSPQDPERKAICDAVVQSLSLDDDHDESWALLGEAALASGDVESAVVALRRAAELGSAPALVRLVPLVEATDRVDLAAWCHARLRQGADDPEVLWARAEAVLDARSLAEDAAQRPDLPARAAAPLPGWVEVAVHRAAMAGQPRACLHLAFASVHRGESDGLAELRRLASTDPHAAWALGHYLWRFRLYGLLSAAAEEPASVPAPIEAYRLLRSAHEQGEMLGTLTLYLVSDAHHEAEFEAVLDQFQITEERRLQALFALEGELLVGLLAEQAERYRQAEDNLTALRLLLAAAVCGDDDAVERAGALLLDEADDGPWASFALFLQRWPQAIGPMAVGSPDTPLLARRRLLPARDDHSSSVPVQHSDFARRIVEAIEQVGWRLHPLGDHLLVGTWESPAAPVVVFVEVPGTFEPDRRASVSIALLAGLQPGQSAPWALPASRVEGDPDTDLDGVAEDVRRAVGPLFRERITDLDATDADYWGMQRRCLEALFRVGEFQAVPLDAPELLPVHLQLSALEGRRMTFAGLPEEWYPRPWITVGPSDYLVSPGIVEHPNAHRLTRPMTVLYAGYDLDAHLSGGHLLTAMVRSVESLRAIAECTIGMYDRDPGIFDEFFHAVPMARLLQVREVFDEVLPEQARGGVNRQRSGPTMSLIEDYNQAWTLLQQGHLDEARAEFERLAAAGQPHALAWVIWARLLDGEPGAARDAWQQHAPLVPLWIAGSGLDARLTARMWAQWPNCQGNAGIAFAATGDDVQAERLWRQAAVFGSAEAHAFRAVLAQRQGKADLAESLVDLLEPSQRAQVGAVMAEVGQQAGGWFAAWAEDCRNLLDASRG